VPAYNNAETLFSQARLWELDGTVFRPTPCPSGHGILPLLVFVAGRGLLSSFFIGACLPAFDTTAKAGFFLF